MINLGLILLLQELIKMNEDLQACEPEMIKELL